MKPEIEAKFLDQDHDLIRRKLTELGAVCEHKMKLMRRTVFDYQNRSLQKKRAWVRLREELDGTIELTLKQVQNDSIDGAHEATVVVSDYEAAKAFIIAIGLQVKGEQESKREVWKHGNVEIMLDEWPWVKPFIEIEGPSEQEVKIVAQQLELGWEQAKFGGITPVFVAQYGLSPEEFESLELSMKFDQPVPVELTQSV